MGNKSSKAYEQWIFCSTCNMAILMDIDSERHYNVINRHAKNNTVVEVPVEWGHITQGNSLYHVHTVHKNGNTFTYNQDKMPLKSCPKPRK